MNNQAQQKAFIVKALGVVNAGFFVASIMVSNVPAFANDLQDLKAATVRYVAAMKAVLSLSEGADCFETTAEAGEYAVAKIAYYDAARQAMPTLLQIAKGQKTDGSYGEELAGIFRDAGEDRDKEVTATLEAKLHQCMSSYRQAEALRAVEHARQIAEQFIEDFGRLEGT